MNLSSKTILITGRTGLLKKALTQRILAEWPKIKRLFIFSSDEQKQFQMDHYF
jgi:UDP-N-acetylglucosamine 4,6-dehydratase